MDLSGRPIASGVMACVSDAPAARIPAPTTSLLFASASARAAPRNGSPMLCGGIACDAATPSARTASPCASRALDDVLALPMAFAGMGSCARPRAPESAMPIPSSESIVAPPVV